MAANLLINSCLGKTGSRPTIFVLVKYYLPGYKAGGALRSVANLVENLGDEFEFLIVTSDRDWTDKESYRGVLVDSWNQIGKAKVFYLSPRNQSLKFISRLLSEVPHDILYLNSFFDRTYTQIPLLARRLGLTPQKQLIIAPRGEFSLGAYRIKRIKKAIYTFVVLRLGLIKNVIWHASTEYESFDIKTRLGILNFQKNFMRIKLASDIPSNIQPYIERSHLEASLGKKLLRLVFISRISPKKNLDFALRVLAKVQVPIEFNIYGPHDDDVYWQQCKNLISKLPPNIIVKYNGEIIHEKVAEILRYHDLFFFPTLGENYGHVIMESLSVGTPVLIANTTPWLDLEIAGVGWDLPLNSEQLFVDKIHFFAQLSVESKCSWRRNVYLYASEKVSSKDIILDNCRLFTDSM
jgi:glycosyltransferase involved in cell wall biosynthesis